MPHWEMRHFLAERAPEEILVSAWPAVTRRDVSRLTVPRVKCKIQKLGRGLGPCTYQSGKT